MSTSVNAFTGVIPARIRVSTEAMTLFLVFMVLQNSFKKIIQNLNMCKIFDQNEVSPVGILLYRIIVHELLFFPIIMLVN